jgi:hypothetical protein
MNKAFIENISEMIFINRKHIFHSPDVVLYHPGHFPELNKQIFELYSNEGFKRISIPNIYNNFLEANEFDYHKEELKRLGIPQEIIYPITGDHRNVYDVVKCAVNSITPEETKILLAGKAFFCRRFSLLATLFGNDQTKFDVLPLNDDRDINKESWYKTKKGRTRVKNEMNVINELLKQPEDQLKDF